MQNRLKLLISWFLVVFIVSALATQIVLSLRKKEPPVIPEGNNLVFSHARVRCPTCLRLEKLIRQTLDEHFAEENHSEAIKFTNLEYDAPENREFAERFHIGTATIILLEQENGTIKRHRELESEVWETQNSDEKFREMLLAALKEFFQWA